MKDSRTRPRAVNQPVRSGPINIRQIRQLRNGLFEVWVAEFFTGRRMRPVMTENQILSPSQFAKALLRQAAFIAEDVARCSRREWVSCVADMLQQAMRRGARS